MATTGGAGFGRLLHAEWTKLRSVRRWMLGVVAAVLTTLLISLLTATGSGSDLNQHMDEVGVIGPDGRPVKDQLHLVYRPLAGDGTVVARVATQRDSHADATAGVMLKQSTDAGSRYAALVVTPANGVRFRANYVTDVAGSGNPAPRWLRLTRSGTTVTGHESADGTAWREVGSVTLPGLPRTVLVGLVVTSPPAVHTDRQFGGSSSGEQPTEGMATIDNVRVEPAQPDTPWRDLDTSTGFVQGGTSTEAAGVFTVTGSGEIAVRSPDTDVPQLGLIGLIVGQIAIIVIAVLFITTEFQRGMIRTTFVTTPRRGRVLAAKALVIGGTAYVTGLIAALVAFMVTQPILRSNGFGPPAYPAASLLDWPVLRAILGAGALLALVSVFSLAVGVILRRSAIAVAGLIVLIIAPVFVADGLPLVAARWLVRSTPTGGLAVLQTMEPDRGSVEVWSLVTPAEGIAVLGGYTVVALAAAYWLLRRRDA
jgi:hypothetical protein